MILFWCDSAVKAHDYRLQIRHLNQTIADRASDWTLLAYDKDPYQRAMIILTLEQLHAVATTPDELLAMVQDCNGPVLVICRDDGADDDTLTLIHQLRRLRRQAPCRVLVCLQGQGARQRLEQLWHGGADGIIGLPGLRVSQFQEALLTLVQGLSCLDLQLSQGLRKSRFNDPAPALSQRELELIQMVSDGRSCEEIGSLLQLRADTIRRQLSILYRKLGVQGQRGLVAWGYERGLLTPQNQAA